MLYAGDYLAAALVESFAFLHLLFCLVVARRRAVLSVRENQLRIVLVLLFRRKRQQLSVPRDQIIALNAMGGLRIVTAAREWCHFSERDHAELESLGGLLRKALQVPEEVPLGPCEMRVQFTGPIWPQPTSGVLGYRAGELTLRSPGQLVPFFIFRAKSGPRRVWAYGSTLNVINLESHEIVGRSPAGQQTSLVISPTTPLLLRRNYAIPPGVAGPWLRTIFFWSPVTFHIYFDDANALQTALGLFWGNEERGTDRGIRS
jgi:hypothetical protein